nr:uncharacterized protein CTRU02_15750 [Colletotrichum truncatum]KAF6780700.1 hypothetical protein CTRU02_15750 [Colletotrichum truncatum]
MFGLVLVLVIMAVMDAKVRSNNLDGSRKEEGTLVLRGEIEVLGNGPEDGAQGIVVEGRTSEWSLASKRILGAAGKSCSMALATAATADGRPLMDEDGGDLMPSRIQGQESIFGGPASLRILVEADVEFELVSPLSETAVVSMDKKRKGGVESDKTGEKRIERPRFICEDDAGVFGVQIEEDHSHMGGDDEDEEEQHATMSQEDWRLQRGPGPEREIAR